MEAHDQDSPTPNATPSSVLDLERRGKSSVERNPKLLPRPIRERDVPGEGPTVFFNNSTTCTKALVNAESSVDETLTSHIQLGRISRACEHCLRRKIKCDAIEPKCGPCARSGIDCCFPTSGQRNLGDEPLKPTEEVEKSGRLAFACVHCLRRKMRCDRAKPKCGQCARSGRDCWAPPSGPGGLSDELPKFTEEASHLRIVRSCEQCRRRKNRCDRAEPKCGQCVRSGRDCWWTPSPHNLGDEPPKLTQEVRKPKPARFREFKQLLNDDDPTPPFPKGPNLSTSPATSNTANHGTHPARDLAYSLPLSPQSRKRWPEQYPQHATQSQLTDGQRSVATIQPLQTSSETPLRTLLAKYYLLDAISQVKVVNVNSCFDVVHAEPPIRPLAESIAWLYANPPKIWMAIRRMIRNLYTDVLHDILNIVSDAKLYTDYVLSHTLASPTLGSIEQQFACPALFDCIRVRHYMLNMLFREIQGFILKLSRPRVESGEESHPDAGSLSNHQHPAKAVPAERGRTQAALDPKGWLQITSQRMWDRILRPTVQGKPCKYAVKALRLTRRSKLNCGNIQQTLRVIAIYSLPLILARYSDKISRVWLKDSIFNEGTFSRLLDL